MPKPKFNIDKDSKVYYWFVYLISDKFIIIQALLYLLLCRNNYQLVNSGGVIIVLSFAASEALKALVRAPRPKNPFLGIRTDTSFPSSHASGTFAMTFAYMYYGTNIWIFLLMLLLSLFTSMGRVLGGAHYVRDVIAGAVLAFVISSVSYYLGLSIYAG